MPSAPPRAYPHSSCGSLVCPSAHGPQHGVPTVGSFRQSPSNAGPPALPVVSPHGRTHAARHSHCQSLPPAGPRERASPAAIQVGQGSPPRPCDVTCGRARAAADGGRTVRKPPMLSQLTLLHGPRLHHGLVFHLHASHALDEANGAERLGKRIGRLRARLDIRHLDHALLHALAHEVVTDVNVLRPGATHRVVNHRQRRLVVAADDHGRHTPRQEAAQTVQPPRLLGCHSGGNVLRLSGRGRHRRLHLAAPDKTAPPL